MTDENADILGSEIKDLKPVGCMFGGACENCTLERCILLGWTADGTIKVTLIDDDKRPGDKPGPVVDSVVD